MLSLLARSDALKFLRSHDRGVLLLMGLMLFFFIIFDGIMGFIAPLIITEHVVSETMLGLIVGTSSMAGALFDIVICRLIPNTNFRRIFLLTFVLAAFFPLVMLSAHAAWMFVLGMGLWGLYYDLYRIATYDFVSHRTNGEEHSASFGLLQMFVSLGYLIAPIIAGLLVGEVVGTTPIMAAYLFLIVSGALYFVLIGVTHWMPQYKTIKRRTAVPFFREVKIWRKLGHRILPVLIVSLFINVIEAFFWTIGPLFSETLTEVGRFGGIFMATHTFPALVVGWIVGSVTIRYGQKRTAIVSLLIGSSFLMAFFFLHNEYLIIAVNLVAAFFTALAAPAISGAYADYIAEAGKISTEIETMEDLSTNTGYVIGPILAGFISEMFGYQAAFGLLGLGGIVIMLIVWRITPKHIYVASLAR